MTDAPECRLEAHSRRSAADSAGGVGLMEKRAEETARMGWAQSG